MFAILFEVLLITSLCWEGGWVEGPQIVNKHSVNKLTLPICIIFLLVRVERGEEESEAGEGREGGQFH